MSCYRRVELDWIKRRHPITVKTLLSPGRAYLISGAKKGGLIRDGGLIEGGGGGGLFKII